jgi:hypothetical protein
VGLGADAPPPLKIWDVLADPHERARLSRVLEGALARAELALPSATGSVAAEAEAVVDATVMRHALLTLAPTGPEPEPRSGAEVLLADPSLDDSPALVWIKDLAGGYLRINRSYAARLGIDEQGIRGRSDADLAPDRVIPEPRLNGHGGGGSEPAQLEYTVEASRGREALTVLRFPLHDLDGAAVAVCGVAATASEAATARFEAERLLRIERWAGLSAAAIRAELLKEWQVDKVEPDEPPRAEAPVDSAPGTAGDAAAELERLRGEVETARVALAQAVTLLDDERAAKTAFEDGLAAEGARAAELERALAEAMRREEELGGSVARLAELETELEAEQGRGEDLGRALAVERARAETAERDLAAARGRAEALERARADAAAAVERVGAEQLERVELERRAGEAEGRAGAAERLTAEAEGRAGEAQRLAAAAEARAGAAEGRAGAAERRAAEVEGRAVEAERLAGEAERRAGESEARAVEVEGRAGEAERLADEAAARAGEAERLADEAAARAGEAEARAGEAKARADEAERRAHEAERRAGEAERELVAERAQAAQVAAELIARAERPESSLAEARAEAERAAVAAKRADAAAELARGRAEGLETALASARQAEAVTRTEVEQARSEIVTLKASIERVGAERETELRAAGVAAERLERERREVAAAAERLERERREVAAAAERLERGRREATAAAAGVPAAVPLPSAQPAPTRGGPTWSHRSQRELAASLAEAAEWRAGLKDALRIVGKEGRWDAVIAWCPDDRGVALRCVAMWMAAPDQHGVFETSTWQRRLSPTNSEAGRAAMSEHARWVGDLRSVEDPQLAAAAGEGMCGSLLVPIRHRNETVGALEFLARESGEPHPETVSALEAVALQLGHFDYLLRRGAEPRWRLGRL